MEINYQKELDKLIKKNTLENRVPSLLLHSCCAPCSSYVLEYLSEFFSITVFYYNPNIYPDEEYETRVQEQKEFIREINDRKETKHSIAFIEGDFDKVRFYQTVKGMEKEKEGGRRCFACYELRLREAAIMAKEGGFDYFTTTLSISPYKNAAKLNEIGKQLEEQYNTAYLYSDFKKKNGYKRSIDLSKEYQLYRQDYCGCIYSKMEREESMETK